VVNSGSSANLLAVQSLGLPKGAEVITPACTFPTTFNPILQSGLNPVVIDVSLGDYNLMQDMIEPAISDRTRAIMFAHTLGVPAEMGKVMEIAKKYGLSVIEDNCDALGTEIHGRRTGSFGDLATVSFYASHHMTSAGGGGMVLVNDNEFERRIRSLRDWGRPADIDKPGKLPRVIELDGVPYDDRYIFETIGYNLKMNEIDAAFAEVQFRKLDFFIQRRRANFQAYYQRIKEYEEFFVLPSWPAQSVPSWFGFALTVRDEMPFRRMDLVQHLEQRGVQTRFLFAGNITRQPAYKGVPMRVAGNLKNSDKVFRDTFFVGVHPGISEDDIEYVCDGIKSFIKRH
jgi:CDP-6-deoxy-D-xylo-4-hexulose-3-dehydrase